MTTPVVARITARNTARSSTNKMHDDDVARSYGFSGGLVPGVTIFAWMCGGPLSAYGTYWLDRGSIEARFVKPIYEGDDAEVICVPGGSSLDLSVSARGAVCATGTASEDVTADCRPKTFRRAPLPEEPPPAGPMAFVLGRDLGTIEVDFASDQANAYLRSIGAEHSIPTAARCAHPGWLILLANLALSRNVTLGPWIHVSSQMSLHSRLRDGERVSALSRVADCFDRKGNRFVDLEVLIVAGFDDRPVASVAHRAIYEPRR
jgi:hypothetical protein